MISKAAEIIRSGGVVAFPTETVYGLGADATNNAACLKIYELKGRPSHNPLIVHLSSVKQAASIAEFNDTAEKLIKHFWPGPLTIVLKRKEGSAICEAVSAGLHTIAIRMPSHETALAFIEQSGTPIAAPSANISNYVSPTEVSHVKEAFGNKIYIVEGEKSLYGLESTIIDVTGDPELLRYGFITPEALESVIGAKVRIRTEGYITAPGMMEKHYSPKSQLRINADSVSENEIFIGFGNVDLGQFNLSFSADLAEAAANLYSMIRKADGLGKEIAVAPIPNVGIGIAINDRLKRAAC